MALVDSHCHLFFNLFKDDLEEVLSRARGSGISDPEPGTIHYLMLIVKKENVHCSA